MVRFPVVKFEPKYIAVDTSGASKVPKAFVGVACIHPPIL
jgi:hypothetical protein